VEDDAGLDLEEEFAHACFVVDRAGKVGGAGMLVMLGFARDDCYGAGFGVVEEGADEVGADEAGEC